MLPTATASDLVLFAPVPTTTDLLALVVVVILFLPIETTSDPLCDEKLLAPTKTEFAALSIEKFLPITIELAALLVVIV